MILTGSDPLFRLGFRQHRLVDLTVFTTTRLGHRLQGLFQSLRSAILVIQLVHGSHITQKVPRKSFPQTNTLIARRSRLKSLRYEYLQKVGPTPILHGTDRQMQGMTTGALCVAVFTHTHSLAATSRRRDLDHMRRSRHRIRLVNPPPRQVQDISRTNHQIHDQFAPHIFLHFLLRIIPRTLSWQSFHLIGRSIHPPPLVSLELQNEHVDIIIMGSKSLGVKGGEIGIRADHASEFGFEKGEHGVDGVVVFVRTEKAEGAVGGVNVGPDILRISNGIFQVVVIVGCG
mmetsp:Transcript_27606/g.57970  ORF Transcript_27606/g.57970 Transcript_27606/m.57970 type:complete len:287 (+) Transcript_27606:594-1454(+)